MRTGTSTIGGGGAFLVRLFLTDPTRLFTLSVTSARGELTSGEAELRLLGTFAAAVVLSSAFRFVPAMRVLDVHEVGSAGGTCVGHYVPF